MNLRPMVDAVEGIDLLSDSAHSEIVDPLAYDVFARDDGHFTDYFLGCIDDQVRDKIKRQFMGLQPKGIYLDASEIDDWVSRSCHLYETINIIGNVVYKAWLESCKAHVENNAEDFLDKIIQEKRGK